MSVFVKFFSIVSISLLSAGCSFFEPPTELNAGMVNSLPIKNLVQSADNAFSGGQPSQVDLSIMKDGGIQHVVNLRPSSEQDWNEGEIVEALGMSYHQVDVAGADDLSLANAQKFGTLINSFGSEPYFVHCASGNRVGALIAINEAIANGKDIEEAIEIGKQWGLKGLAHKVRSVFQNQLNS
jgi:protein tyrosine phosphatase (PTP) superfamily phosphohydrolase (DUF442 family)